MREGQGNSVPPIVKRQRIAKCATIVLLVITIANLVGLSASGCFDGCRLSSPRVFSCKKNNFDYCCQYVFDSTKPNFCSNFNDCVKYQLPCKGAIIIEWILASLAFIGITINFIIFCFWCDQIQAYQSRVSAQNTQGPVINQWNQPNPAYPGYSSHQGQHLLNGERYDDQQRNDLQQGYSRAYIYNPPVRIN